MGLEEIVKKQYVENDNTLCFKTTPLFKIFILSLVTFGIYDFFISYNYWKTLKENFGYDISPFWRCVFMHFTNFNLFSTLDKYFHNFNMKLPSGILFAFFYLMFSNSSGNALHKAVELDKTNWTMLTIGIILHIFSTLILVYIQSKINIINKQYYPNAPKNPWKVSNVVWVIICILAIII